MSICKHDHDPRINSGHIVWHDDKNFEYLVHHLIRGAQPSRFVETGTHMGWTSHWVARHYPWLPIYTAEVDADYFKKSWENLVDFPQVVLHHGHSPTFLRQLMPMMKSDPRPSLIWLDAHWWPPVPLREECSIVAQLDRYICLIDDFECKDPDFGGDMFENGRCNLEYVAEALQNRECWRPAYAPQPGYKGYGLFTKGIDYEPPTEIMRKDRL